MALEGIQWPATLYVAKLFKSEQIQVFTEWYEARAWLDDCDEYKDGTNAGEIMEYRR